LIPEPVAFFGHLLRSCISDEKGENLKGFLSDGVALVGLGMLSSVLTTYVLTQAGIFV
jgi:hypothetical protein